MGGPSEIAIKKKKNRASWERNTQKRNSKETVLCCTLHMFTLHKWVGGWRTNTWLVVHARGLGALCDITKG